MRIRVVIFLLCLFSLSFFTQKEYLAKQEFSPLELMIATNEKSLYKTVKAIENKRILKGLENSEMIGTVERVPFSDMMLRFGETIYIFDRNGFYYDKDTLTVHQPDDKTRRKLLDLYEGLKKEHYGQLISWSEIDGKIPKYTQFDILDLDTGISFKVERRAGSGHADVQPVTYEDTKKMKQIYKQWSWKRRAIAIRINDDLFAASMNGMPHGKGAIRNGFPGHFCIHFKDSIVHKTRKQDLAHQMMVYKGAGKIGELQGELTASEVAQLFVEALDHRDEQILEQLTSGRLDSFIQSFLKRFEGVRFDKAIEEDFDPALLVSRVIVNITPIQGGRFAKKRELIFYCKRTSPTEGWSIDTIVS